jgi:hypothetical protein
MNLDYDEIRLRLCLRTTPEQDEICRMAEKIGLRFLVDFGIDNAEQMIDQRINEWLDKTEAAR